MKLANSYGESKFYLKLLDKNVCSAIQEGRIIFMKLDLRRRGGEGIKL
jgi:hypothetical protein